MEFEREATKRFEKKVSESISDNKPLECVGYFLPTIEFRKYLPTTTFRGEKSFSQPVDFTKATFPDRASLFLIQGFPMKQLFIELNSPNKQTLAMLHSLNMQTLAMLHSPIMHSFLELNSPNKQT
ncbi:MAG TPA: hypothetical protein VFR94_04255 [Nitrososphaeraceae archaeon]|nr:hypothetical protein [Nitrososphaeraceae archaeon]